MEQTRAYTIIEHPADLGIEAYGRTLIEAFEEAAYGMISIIVERETIRSVSKRRITLASSDVEQLLVKWLSELLYLYDGEHFLPSEITIDDFSETALTATVFGELFDAARHMPRSDVKAVTYHQLCVDRENKRVCVMLDV
jgi:SHS2 domain-containing protein